MLEPTHNINVPLLRKELEFITAHPEEWNQATWGAQTACGTVACLAGNTVIHHYPADALHWRKYYSYINSIVGDPSIVELDGVKDKEGFLFKSVGEAAQELFGLTEYQASCLFSGSNTLRDLWEFANQFTNGEIEVPEGVKKLNTRYDRDRDL